MNLEKELLNMAYELETRFKVMRSLSSEVRRFGLEGNSEMLNMEFNLSWLDVATKDDVIRLFTNSSKGK